jgi:hypothetical protein
VLRLVRYGVISGRISPVRSGQVVAVERVPAGAVSRTFRTNVNNLGEFRLFGLPPSRYVVAALNGSTETRFQLGLVFYGSSGQPHEFVITGGEEYEGIDVFTAPSESFGLSGTVLAPEVETSFPLTLQLVSADHPSVVLWTRLVRSREGFRIENVLPGAYDLIAVGMPEGRPRLFGRIRCLVDAPGVDNLVIPMGPARDVEAAPGLEPAGAIRGRVERTDATPRLAVVLIDVTPGRASPVRVMFTDADAEFGFGDLPPGQYSVAVHSATDRAGRWAPASGGTSAVVQISPGETKVVEIRIAGR